MIFGVSRWFYIAAFLLALLFVFVPQIDLFVSGLFYNETVGFFWSRHPLVIFLYNIPRPIVIIASVGLLLLIADLIFKKRFFSIRPLLLFYFAAVMIVGPGLIVHSVFKDHWGRARPAQTTEFGGTKNFTPAFIISDQCERNCSFVSGHSAGAYGLIALALLVRRRKGLAMAGAITVGSLVGLGRIIQGGHFFSDVLFSFVIVYLSAKILYHFTFEKGTFDIIDRRSVS
jgi:lipid A 4'-phosphatase